ncbi:MAG: hypothetical protein Q9197_003508 [Variospora fuerteventurae]
MDPFDDVRELAASILNKSLQTSPEYVTLSPHKIMSERHTLPVSKSDDIGDALLLHDKPFWARVMHRAVSRMQISGRADHADGFGRLYDIYHGSHGVSSEGTAWGENPHIVLGNLISDIEQCIASARSNLHLAVGTAPLHGYLIAARYLIPRYKNCGHAHPNDKDQAREWVNLIHKLLENSVRVWDAVKGILCADAPEGYEIGTANELSIGAKPTPISQAFRHGDYRAFGELVFEQLAELRHRGAFSTVSQTFAECCLRCAQSDDPRTQALPKEWYQKTLLCIQERGSALTRRSAGLPAMITSILTAYPEGDFFDSVICDLQTVAGKGSGDRDHQNSLRLPQVHGFNCLKDILTETKFGDSVERHVSVSLEIAVRGLESDKWAIRNCGLMLLKALITRMNDGTNTASSKVSSSHRRLSTLVYDKYQNLPDLLLRLLNPEKTINEETLRTQSQATSPNDTVLQAQHVFPALEIIEQSGIPERHQSEIRQAVWFHLEGPVWPIREKAAKALSYLPVSDQREEEMRQYLQTPWFTQNALHGRYLYLRFMFAQREYLLTSKLVQDVTTRRAAVDSLANFFEVIKELPAAAEWNPVLLELYLLIYTSLLDDNEDIRDTGATVASKLLDSTTSQNPQDRLPLSLMVPAARDKLLEHLKHNYHDSPSLWTHSLQRLLGLHLIPSVNSRKNLLFPSPKALLEDANREDPSLFAEEKQNLYVDNAQEARVWQEVLLSLDRSTADADHLRNLHVWAVDGVDALIEVAERENLDGPLGWTSKPDVFTLGVRILLAVEVALRVSANGGIANQDEVLRQRIRKLFEVGKECELRPAWMRMLRDIADGFD